MSSGEPQEDEAGDVAAVVPAAGASRRMGRPKLLLPWEGSTVLEATLAALLSGGVDRVVVVTEPGGGILARWPPPPRVTLAENPTPRLGMLSSVRAGLAALAAAAPPRLLLVCPGDLPALRAETVRELLAVQRRHGGIVVPACRGRRGHPILVPRRWLPEIGRLDEAVGLRQLLRVAADDLLAQPVEDAGTVLDVDTPEAYESLRAERASRRD
jgi:CTP:molybdopterin cytidylyltransferase MocA